MPFSENIRDRFVALWAKGLQTAARMLMQAQVHNMDGAVDLAANVVRSVLGGIVNESTLSEAQHYAKPHKTPPRAA